MLADVHELTRPASTVGAERVDSPVRWDDIGPGFDGGEPAPRVPRPDSYGVMRLRPHRVRNLIPVKCATRPVIDVLLQARLSSAVREERTSESKRQRGPPVRSGCPECRQSFGMAEVRQCAPRSRHGLGCFSWQPCGGTPVTSSSEHPRSRAVTFVGRNNSKENQWKRRTVVTTHASIV
jgi:hypothetical protein